MPIPKFNFVPERQLQRLDTNNSCWKVSLLKGKTTSLLSFPREMVRIFELDQKFIRLFADQEKKVIGWSILEGNTSLELLNDARKLKINNAGSMLLGIGKLLDSIGYEHISTIKNLEVKKYSSTLIKDEIWYIELPSKVVSNQ